MLAMNYSYEGRGLWNGVGRKVWHNLFCLQGYT